MGRHLFLALTAGVMLAVGIAADMQEQRRVQVEWESDERLWQGVVVEPSRSTAKTWRTAVVTGSGGGCRRVMLSVLKTAMPQRLRVGDAIEFRCEIRRPYNYLPSGAKADTLTFDYAKWLQRQGFSGQGFVPREVRMLGSSERRQIVQSLPLLDRLRISASSMRERLLGAYGALPLSTDEGAVLAAITLGDKSRVSKEVRERFSLSGASHVLALSGLHLSILVSFLLLLLYPLRLRRWSKWLMAVVCLSVAWAFVMLTGCSVSIVRSALMLSLMLLLGMRGEGFASLNNVVVAAFLILCVSPRSLMDVGFQMSFLAVFFIIYFMPYYQELLPWYCPQWKRRLFDFLYVTVIAQLATVPVVACVFGRLPLMFLLTNMLVIPCAYLLLLGALLFFALSWWPAVSAALGSMLGAVLTAMMSGLEWIAALPFASVEVRLAPLAALCLYPLLFTAIAWIVFRRRAYAYWSLFLLGAAVTCQLWMV